MWPTVAAVTVASAGILLVVSRSLRLLFHSVIGRRGLRLPPRVASVVGVTSLLLAMWLLVSGVLVKGALALARQAFAPRDSATPLVLSKLQRTGAFSRSVLVVATTTGTGFLDPAAMDLLEYLHRRNTAIAGVQYSYLPSWISLLADQEAFRRRP